MQDCFMTEATQTRVTMNDLDLFSDYDIAKDREERENRRKGGLSIDDQKWDMVDLQSVRQVMDTRSAFVSMRDNHNLVPSVNQFSCQLIDMAFHASGLWKEEVADHGDVVRHLVSMIGVRPFEQQSFAR
jgi:hypothetical protein